MAWVKIDDQFTDHPKAADAGPLGIAMQVAGLCYANRHLTDGFISHKVAARLLDFTGIAVELPSRADPDDNHVSAMRVLWLNVCDSLVSAGLWEVVDGGWQIHDFLEYNPSRADTLTKRAADLERKRTPKGTAQPSDNIPNGIRSDSTRPVPVPVPVPVPTPKEDASHEAIAATNAPRTTPKPPTSGVNPLWEALISGIGIAPQTAAERSHFGKAVKELRDIATPEDVLARCANYRATWPDMDLTPDALVKHWSRMEHPPSVRPLAGRGGRRETLSERNNRAFEEAFGHESDDIPEVVEVAWRSN